MSLHEITLPGFGSSVGEATIVKWLVAPGSEVEAGQIIAEVETDKAMADLEAPESGVIESLEVAEGQEGVEVGTVVARFMGASPARETDLQVKQEVAAEEAGNPDPLKAQNSEPGIEPRHADASQERILASPYAKKLAGERSIDLSGIAGSGPGGRVISLDLATAGGMERVPVSRVLDDSAYPPGSYEWVPVNKMRRAIADGLSRSVQEIPHYSLMVDLDFEAVLEHRQAVNHGNPNDAARISVNDYIVWACAQALMAVPAANSSWTTEGIARHRHANIALAVAIDDGLVTPVLRAAERFTLKEIAVASSDVIRRSRARQLKTSELEGATFSVSNLGMLGVRSFTSILSQPQACILSVGAVSDRPVVVNGELVISKQASCTLTCDHRVVDGAVGAEFLQKLDEYLRSPPN